MSFNPFTAEAIADPYPQYAQLRITDPVHWSEKLRGWVLFRYDDVVAFFRDDERLSSDRAAAAKFRGPRPPAGTPRLRTVASDPPDHDPVRGVLNAALLPRVRAVGPRVDATIAALLERIGAATERAVTRTELVGEVDLIADFAYPLPITIIADLLAIPAPDREQFQTLSRAIARGMDRFYSGGAAAEGLQELGAYFVQLLGQRQTQSAADDLMQALMVAEHRGDRLAPLEVVALCTALVFGGHETTVNLLGNGVLALLRDPEALAALRAEPALVPPAVEELLRFDSPAQFISRTARVEFAWNGRSIRAGDAVLAALGSANRDPAVFAAPDRLNLHRAPNPHVAFGLGTHVCPGAQLSRIEARAAIAALLRSFPGLRLADRPPVRRTTAVLRGLESLPVRVD
jgi:cytochrome P450